MVWGRNQVKLDFFLTHFIWIFGVGWNNELLHTWAFLPICIYLCLQKWSVALLEVSGWSWSNPSPWDMSVGISDTFFFWAICYRICLICVQFLYHSCLGAEVGSSPARAAGGSCCPVVLCGCWPAWAVSLEKLDAHIWVSRSQTFRVFCQKPQWFGRFSKLMPLLAFIDVRPNYFIYTIPCCMKECSECVRRRLCCLLLLM